MNETIDQAVADYGILACIAAGFLIAAALSFRLFLPRMIVARIKRKMPADQRDTFDYLQEILELEEVVELYAPSKRYMKELPAPKDKDTKAPTAKPQSSWLSPYPKAVAAANTRNRVAKTSKRVIQARKQIAEAAKYVSVIELPDEQQPGNPGCEHFYIVLRSKGKAEAKIHGLADTIKTQLELHSLTRVENNDYGNVWYIGHQIEPEDKLEQMPVGTEFFEENRAERVTSIPLAIKADGTAWPLPTHHTLIHGTTGSGKSSPIQGIIRQLEPFINQGVVKLYGVDPKNAELKPYVNTSLFEGIALGNNIDMMNMIFRAHALMKVTQDSIEATEDNDHGRSVPFTKQTPLVLIIIDELLSLLTALKTMGKPGALCIQQLTEITSQGRSGNIFVIAATQNARQDLMGEMRENFTNKIVLRLEDGQQYWNNTWLGDGADARGFNAMSIRKAGPENGYATAGVGYVKEMAGNPVKVRFARTTAADLTAIIKRNPRKVVAPEVTVTAAALPVPVPTVSAPTLTDYADEYDDGDFNMVEELPPLTDSYDDGDDQSLPPLF